MWKDILDPVYASPDHQKVAILYSGGLDSSVAIAHFLSKGWDVYPFIFDDDTVDYHSKVKPAAVQFLTHYNLYSKRKVIRLYDCDEVASNDTLGFVPGWKMAIQLSAMAYCQALGIHHLVYGYNEGNETYRDESHESITAMQDLYNKVYNSSIVVWSPYYKYTKAHMVSLGHELRIPFQYTISCSEVAYPGLLHCGTCELCRRRLVAFKANHLTDPVHYVNPGYWPSKDYMKEVNNEPDFKPFSR